jgi:predicted dehydrogenase
VRVLLVGLGRWGEKHLRVLRSLGATVWIAEASPVRRAWALSHGIDPGLVVSDYRDALREVDAVDIVTPPDSHLALATASLDAGRDCFVEKPMTLTGAEARALSARVAGSGRVVQVGHIFRFHPVTACVREALARGCIGAVRYITGRFAGFKRPRADVGVTQTDSIHYFDLFAHLLGREPTGVTATLRDYLGRGLDDVSFATVDYGDIPAFVEAGYFAPGTSRECVLVGERGSLIADFSQSTVIVISGTHVPRADGWDAVEAGKEALEVGGGEPLELELAAFLAAVRRQGPSPVDVGTGLRALETVEGAVLSSRLGRRVSLAELRDGPPGSAYSLGPEALTV